MSKKFLLNNKIICYVPEHVAEKILFRVVFSGTSCTFKEENGTGSSYLTNIYDKNLCLEEEICSMNKMTHLTRARCSEEVRFGRFRCTMVVGASIHGSFL